MKRNLLRIAAAVAMGLAAGPGLVLGAGAAAAAAPTTIGTVSVSPASGNASTPGSLITSEGCPTSDTFVSAVVNATGWDNVQVVGRTDIGISHTASFSVPIGDTLLGIAQSNGLTLNPGKYTFTLNCLPDAFSGPDNVFVGSIWLTGTAAGDQPYQSVDWTPVATTTALTVTPSGSATEGQNVTLKAAITPFGSTGTATFKDNGTTIPGAGAVAVTGGVATFSSTAFAAGSHSFTAEYSGADGAGPSTSAAAPYSVLAVGSTAAGVSSAASATQNVPVVFTVTTTGATSGTVTLLENGNTLGTTTITNGSGTVSVVFSTPGHHSVTAHFVPAGNIAPSDSAAVVVDVSASNAPTAHQTIETTIAAGSLTMSIPDVSTVVLPTPTLDPNAGDLTTSGAIHPVNVTDTRAGAPGFTVTGLASDFENAAGDKIDAANLGWTPNVIDFTAGMVVTAGAHVGSAPGVQPGSAADPALGIKSSRMLASNAAGHNGTTHLSAVLELSAPTSTQAGTYDSILTLTAI